MFENGKRKFVAHQSEEKSSNVKFVCDAPFYLAHIKFNFIVALIARADFDKFALDELVSHSTLRPRALNSQPQYLFRKLFPQRETSANIAYLCKFRLNLFAAYRSHILRKPNNIDKRTYLMGRCAVPLSAKHPHQQHVREHFKFKPIWNLRGKNVAAVAFRAIKRAVRSMQSCCASCIELDKVRVYLLLATNKKWPKSI